MTVVALGPAEVTLIVVGGFTILLGTVIVRLVTPTGRSGASGRCLHERDRDPD